MNLHTLHNQLENNPVAIEFNDVMDLVASLYNYQPTEFSNGLNDDKIVNAAGTNEGSCRLFAYAMDQGFTQEQTLHCFGAYYRNDVLLHPENTDHGNIRNFIKYGWDGIHFAANPLARNA